MTHEGTLRISSFELTMVAHTTAVGDAMNHSWVALRCAGSMPAWYARVSTPASDRALAIASVFACVVMYTIVGPGCARMCAAARLARCAPSTSSSMLEMERCRLRRISQEGPGTRWHGSVLRAVGGRAEHTRIHVDVECTTDVLGNGGSGGCGETQDTLHALFHSEPGDLQVVRSGKSLDFEG
jgi:hypothetical protein